MIQPKYREPIIHFILLFIFGGAIFSFLTSLSADTDVSTVEKKQAKAEIKNNTAQIPILVYHGIRKTGASENAMQKRFNISPEILEKEFSFLKNEGYETISFMDLYEAFSNNKPLPQKPIIISFDDGWKNQYTVAFPLLKKFGMRATFFVISGVLDGDLYMTSENIKEMSDAGMEIGAHTKNHPYLDRLSAEIAREEITGSKTALQKIIGKPITTFAYPYGHFNNETAKIVEQSGFRTARNTFLGITSKKDNLFRLKSIEATENINLLIRNLAGLE